jgi:uncharacterized protein YkwD
MVAIMRQFFVIFCFIIIVLISVQYCDEPSAPAHPVASVTPPLSPPVPSAPLSPVIMPPANPSDELLNLEWAIVQETNLARTRPQDYASKLSHLRSYFAGNWLKLPHIDAITLEIVTQQLNHTVLHGLPAQLQHYYGQSIQQLYQHYQQNPHIHLTINVPGIETKEGPAAVDEAIEFLAQQAPLAGLNYSIGLTYAARDHVLDQGRQGFVGHVGNDGSQSADRVNRYGTWRKAVGENIAYGYATAEGNIIGLIVDDGVPDRGHRHNIFNPDFRYIGVACGYHSYYDIMCVMNYAGDYYE